jgi:hydrogenase nickel incorporation protein HypA/HybF
MHELSIAEAIVDIAAESSGGGRVLRVVVEVGKLAAVLPDALRFSFEVVAAGTPVEGAALEIVEKPGDELRVKQLEVT